MKKLLFVLPLLLFTMCDKRENEFEKGTRHFPADSDSVSGVGVSFQIDTTMLDPLNITF